MKTLLPTQISESDRPFISSRGNVDGTVTLYYEGDIIPPLVIPETPTKPIPIESFRDRFTEAELVSVVISADPGIKMLLLKLQTATEVDLLSQTVIDGMAYLGTKIPAFTPARIAQILA